MSTGQFQKFPNEILLKICSYLCAHCTSEQPDDPLSLPTQQSEHLYDAQASLINISKTCTKLRDVATPFIYHAPVVGPKGLRKAQRKIQLDKLTDLLALRPDLSRQLRCLLFMPPNLAPEYIMPSVPISSEVEMALYFPPQDKIYAALDRCCFVEEVVLFFTNEMYIPAAPDTLRARQLRYIHAVGSTRWNADLRIISPLLVIAESLKMIHATNVRFTDTNLPILATLTHLELEKVKFKQDGLPDLFARSFPNLQLLDINNIGMANLRSHDEIDYVALLSALVPIRATLTHLRLTTRKRLDLQIRTSVRQLTHLQTIDMIAKWNGVPYPITVIPAETTWTSLFPPSIRAIQLLHVGLPDVAEFTQLGTRVRVLLPMLKTLWLVKWGSISEKNPDLQPLMNSGIEVVKHGDAKTPLWRLLAKKAKEEGVH